MRVAATKESTAIGSSFLFDAFAALKKERNQLWQSVVTLGGFEPNIASVKGLCPNLLDDSAIDEVENFFSFLFSINIIP